MILLINKITYEKNTILFLTLLLVVAGSVSLYRYTHKLIVLDGHALLPEIKKEELIRQSDTIVVGQVENLQSVKVPSEIRKGEEDVVTNVTLHVETYLRNYSDNSSEEIIVQTLGGIAGNLTMHVEDAATFQKGEHVLVFLKKKNDNAFAVYGWAQGKYSIDSKGNVGMGEKEFSFFQSVFGSKLTLAQVEDQIALFKDVAPKKEFPALDYSSENGVMSADEKNAEANSVLKEGTQ